MYRLVITPYSKSSDSYISNGDCEFYLDSSDDVCTILDGLVEYDCFYYLSRISILSSDEVIKVVKSKIIVSK